MNNKNILFAGLAVTGKTSFLAALWYYIFNSFSDEGFTVHTTAEDEREYLNQRSNEWASCKSVLRTSLTNIEDVSISIHNKMNNEIIKLQIPDISGEAFKKVFKDRFWSHEFDDIIEESSGMLLFIDPIDEKNSPKFIYHDQELYQILNENIPNSDGKLDFDEDNVPNQVKMVDFLQMINYHKPGMLSKVSLIISRWDLVEKIGTEPKNPELWCKKNVPLLYQYFLTNSDDFQVKYFGVSAQGGDYENSAERLALLHKDPIERIIIVEGTSKTNQILNPVLWITNGN